MKDNAVAGHAPIACAAILPTANGSAGRAILRARSSSNCLPYYRERSR